jgi:hypothetical protein
MCKHLLLALFAGSLLLTNELADKKGKQSPAPGTIFHFSPSSPRYVTCDVEFRDPGDNLWPNFFYGKPAADGTFVFDAGKPTASFTLVCDTMVQRNGDQGRRVLGELVKAGKPPVVKLTVQSLGAVRTEFVEAGKGGKKSDYHPAQLVLDVDGKKVTVPGKVTSKFAYAKGSDTPESVYLEIQFTLEPRNLGLKNGLAVIECRAGATGFVQLDAGKKK